MSEYTEVVALVEGRTEKIFIADLLAPYLAGKGVFMTPIVISKPGQKGGDVRFSRVKNDILMHLKQRHSTYLTLCVNFYGIKNDWPGFFDAKKEVTPSGKAAKINDATRRRVGELFGESNVEKRFIPYVAMHEFEALLFSDPEKLAQALQVSPGEIEKIIAACGEPENIDDSPQTAPSKRLEKLCPGFRKTSTGIAIAKAIGLTGMREKCPVFNEWLGRLENLKEA
jgi:hypothetical protein